VPGVMERFGLGYEELRRINPRSSTPPRAASATPGLIRSAGYDMIVQAAGGVMSVTGPVDEAAPPVRVGTSIGDITAALFVTIGIVTALHQRHATGQGRRWTWYARRPGGDSRERIARYEVFGKPPRPLGTAHPSITPFQLLPPRTRGSSSPWAMTRSGRLCAVP